MPNGDPLLGEPSVYPGHPITIAYLITMGYESWADANVRHPQGHGWPHPLGNGNIPGAGSCVYLALDLLKDIIENGVSVDQAFRAADQMWGSVDNMAEGGGSFAKDEESRQRFLTRYAKGLAQAERVKSELAARLRTWPKAADGGTPTT